MFDSLQAEVTQRLTNSKEAANRSGSMLSHEDLAKKLKVTLCLYLDFGCILIADKITVVCL